MGMSKEQWNNEVKRFQQRQQRRRENFERDWKAQTKESVLRRYGTDPLVSFGAGVAKLPSDLTEMVIPNNQFSNWWEGNINEARDSMQTESLVNQRNQLKELFSKSKGQINQDILNFIADNPRVGLNYLAELGIPAKGILKAGNLVRKAGSEKEILDIIKAKGDVAFTTSQLVNDLRDASQYSDNKNQYQIDNINNASKNLLNKWQEEAYLKYPLYQSKQRNGENDIEEANKILSSLPIGYNDDRLNFIRYGETSLKESKGDISNPNYLAEIAIPREYAKQLLLRGQKKQLEQSGNYRNDVGINPNKLQWGIYKSKESLGNLQHQYRRLNNG